MVFGNTFGNISLAKLIENPTRTGSPACNSASRHPLARVRSCLRPSLRLDATSRCLLLPHAVISCSQSEVMSPFTATWVACLGCHGFVGLRLLIARNEQAILAKALWPRGRWPGRTASLLLPLVQFEAGKRVATTRAEIACLTFPG